MNTNPSSSNWCARPPPSARRLVAAPIIQGCLQGRVSLPSYVAFLHRGLPPRAPHGAAAAGLQGRAAAAPCAWLDAALDEYIEEEAGHDEWILDDIARLRRRRRGVRHGRPGHATEVMVAYAYDTDRARQPARLLRHGARARRHQRRAGAAGGRPDPGPPATARRAPSATCARTARWTRSTPRTSPQLMDRIDAPEDRAAIVHAARAFYRLYGDVFRGLPLPQPEEALRMKTDRGPRAADRRHRRHRPARSPRSCSRAAPPCCCPAARRRSWPRWPRARRPVRRAASASHWHAADLDDPAALAGAARCRRRAGSANVLVNNAGVPSFGRLESLGAEHIEQVLRTNLLAPMLLTQALLPSLRRQPRAQVIQVGSALGRIGLPGYSVYSASKFGLRGFAEALRRELRDSPVRVQYLGPRSTRTGFNDAPRRRLQPRHRHGGRHARERGAVALAGAARERGRRALPRLAREAGRAPERRRAAAGWTAPSTSTAPA